MASNCVRVLLLVQDSSGRLLYFRPVSSGANSLCDVPSVELALGESLKSAATRCVAQVPGLVLKSLELVCVNSVDAPGSPFIAIGVLARCGGSPQPAGFSFVWSDAASVPANLAFAASVTVSAFRRGVFSLDFE